MLPEQNKGFRRKKQRLIIIKQVRGIIWRERTKNLVFTNPLPTYFLAQIKIEFVLKRLFGGIPYTAHGAQIPPTPPLFLILVILFYAYFK